MHGQLPRGITGFYSPAEDAPPPLVEYKAFKAACYHVVRQVGGITVTFHPSEGKVAQNYHAVMLNVAGHDFAVLCNMHYPLIACCTDLNLNSSYPQFIEAPVLFEGFWGATSFMPLEPAWLQAPPTPQVLAQLSEVERQQIRYWKPERIGDIIFNRWD